MKKYLLLFLMLIGSISIVRSQNQPNPKSEKIQALKIAFITQKLQLTRLEAERFWPIYNEYENEINSLRANRNGDVLENEEKLLNIRKKYQPSFEKVIGPQKLNQFFNAEREFRNVLIKQLKNRKQQRFK